MAKTRKQGDDLNFVAKYKEGSQKRRFVLHVTRKKLLDRWKLSAVFAPDEASEIYAAPGDQAVIEVSGPGLKRPVTLHFRAPRAHVNCVNPVYPLNTPFEGYTESRIVEIEPHTVLTIAQVNLGKNDYVIYPYSIKDGLGKTLIDPEIIVGSPDAEGPG